MIVPGTDPPIPAPLERRFEAIVFDWDAVAEPGRPAAANRLRRLVEEACDAGIELAIVSEADVETVDGQLKVASPIGGPTVLTAELPARP